MGGIRIGVATRLLNEDWEFEFGAKLFGGPIPGLEGGFAKLLNALFVLTAKFTFVGADEVEAVRLDADTRRIMDVVIERIGIVAGGDDGDRESIAASKDRTGEGLDRPTGLNEGIEKGGTMEFTESEGRTDVECDWAKGVACVAKLETTSDCDIPRV